MLFRSAVPEAGYSVKGITTTSGASVSWNYVTVPAGSPANSVAISFKMPNENVGVTVEFQEGDPPEFTANIILHDNTTQGDAKFDANNQYSITAPAGTDIGAWVYANTGYYIVDIEFDPDTPYQYNGSFTNGDLDFVMQNYNVNIHVYFDDDPRLKATLKVFDYAGYDPTRTDNHHASMEDTATGDTTVDTYHLGKEEIRAEENDVVKITVSDPRPGFTVTVDVTAGGTPITTKLNPDGTYEFDMPALPTTVTVTYKQGEPDDLWAELEYDVTEGSATISATIGGTTVTKGHRTTDGKLEPLHAGDVVTDRKSVV